MNAGLDIAGLTYVSHPRVPNRYLVYVYCICHLIQSLYLTVLLEELLLILFFLLYE